MKKKMNENRLLVIASIILLLVIGWIIGTTIYMTNIITEKENKINQLLFELEYNNYAIEDSLK